MTTITDAYDQAEELPFDPIAMGWPDMPRDFDYRPLLTYGVQYRWPVPSYCTVCSQQGDHNDKDRCIIVLGRHDGLNFIEGYIHTRCPDHPWTGHGALPRTPAQLLSALEVLARQQVDLLAELAASI